MAECHAMYNTAAIKCQLCLNLHLGIEDMKAIFQVCLIYITNVLLTLIFDTAVLPKAALHSTW